MQPALAPAPVADPFFGILGAAAVNIIGRNRRGNILRLGQRAFRFVSITFNALVGRTNDITSAVLRQAGTASAAPIIFDELAPNAYPEEALPWCLAQCEVLPPDSYRKLLCVAWCYTQAE